MSFSKIFWGFVFLLLGVSLLGVNFHWWNINIWHSILSLWPVILILLGISIAFGESNPIGVILFIIVLIGALVFVLSPIKISDDHFSFGTKSEQSDFKTKNYSLPLSGEIKKAEINLDLGAANINFKSLDNNYLYDATFKSSTDLNTTDVIDGDTAKITLKEDFQGFANFANGNERQLDLNLNKNMPLDISINSGASKLNLNLADLIINNLQISAGASNQDITVGAKSDVVKVIIDAGASGITLRLPKEYSLKILSESGLLKNNFDNLSLEKSGNIYKSSDFESNAKKIDLEIRAGASNMQIERY